MMLSSGLVYLLAGIYPLFKPDFTTLVATRLVLGLAAGFLATLSLTRASEYSAEKRNKLIGFASAIAGMSAVVSITAAGF